MAGYTRNDTANNIADGNIINASDLDGEFDAVQSAFNASTGHTHDGTSGEGAPIEQVGPVQDLVITASEVKPKTTNTLDLGTSLLQYKNLYVDGSAFIDGLGESMLVDGSSSIQFRDSALAINSSTDGQLDIDADIEVEITVSDAAGIVDINANSVNISNDLNLDSDGAILSLGENGEVTLTHVHNTGLDLKNASGFDLNLQTSDTTIESGNLIGKITFNAPDEAGGSDAILVGASIEALAEATFDSTTNSTAIVFKTNTSGAATERMRITSAGDLHFLDNRKAIFGAGSDLQIYHDGSNSIIEDVGTGDLFISGAGSVGILNGDRSEYMINAVQNGAVTAYHNGSAKLATTTTGIDVTGTVTADGFLKDNQTANFKIVDFGASSTEIAVETGGQLNITTESNNPLQFKTNDAKRAEIEGDGDIIFYASDATTKGFFWDASAESLGIGTTSPSEKLHLVGDMVITPRDQGIKFNNEFVSVFRDIDSLKLSAYSGITFFDTNASTARMVIDSSGNVGIGATSPGAKLEVSDTDGEIRITGTRGTDTTHRIHTGGTNSQAFNITSGSTSGNAIYHNSTSHIFRNQTGATEYARISSDGNVGIGTSSPAQALHLNTSGSDVLARFQSSAGYTDVGMDSGPFVINTTSSSGYRIRNNGSDAVMIDSSGKVGIGTTSPSELLEIEKDQNAATLLEIDNNTSGTAAASGIRVRSNAASFDIRSFSSGFTTSNQYIADSNLIESGSSASGGLVISQDGALPIQFYTNDAERMRIDSSGNLLVGTTDTFAHVSSSSGEGVSVSGQYNAIYASRSGGELMQLNRQTSDGEIIRFRKDGSTVGSIGTFSAGNTYFKGDSTSHSVGAGDTGVQYNATNDQVRPYNIDSGSTRDAAIDIGGTGARFKDLYLSGGALAGITTASGKFAAQGDDTIKANFYSKSTSASTGTHYALSIVNSAGTTVGTITHNNSSTTYNTSSDYRLKENVVDMTGAVDRVKALNPSQFNFIADPDTTVDGFLAHEVSDVVPEAVTGTKDAMTTEEYEVTPAVLDEAGNVVTEAVMGTREVPDYQGIDQSKLVPLLTGALQEAIARIETLETTQADLLARIETLEGN